MSQFNNVSVLARANVFADGKCVSHTVMFPDGSRKTVGVIMPGTLSFNTGAPEVMEVVEGHCKVRIGDDAGWQEFGPGQSFNVAANTKFDIEALDTFHYICHFG